jgi:hypothetical protein
VDDETIRARISALIEREHALRARREDGSLSLEAEQSELQTTEEELDQCWDLLRQRRAKREFGEDADDAGPRSTSTVEGYLQ